MRVLFLSAEAVPLVKVGGLGDVAGSLPRALRALGHDVRVAIPDSPAASGGPERRHLADFRVSVPDGELAAAASEVVAGGAKLTLISGDPIPRDGRVYGSGIAEDGPKFAFFCRAALEACRAVGWRPDVVHAQDSHAAPAAAWLAGPGADDPFFQDTASLLTIHNLPYMGAGAGGALAAYGIPTDGPGIPEWARGGMLPVGIAHADEITTVSPTYAREIVTPEFGCGLDGLLRTRAKRLSGIVNGLDLESWNPAADPDIARPFDRDRLDARPANRAALEFELGLEADPAAPLLGIVSRLDHQKGFDIAFSPLRRWLSAGGALAVLGSGDRGLEEGFAALSREFPSRAAVRFRFDGALARRIYAGSDAFLIPSRYEPCGLTQMIAMRYGSIPVARETGGLADTIRDAASPSGTGILFRDFDPTAVDAALARARALFASRATWESLMRRAMAEDFSWTRSAQRYDALYARAAARKRPAPLAAAARVDP